MENICGEFILGYDKVYWINVFVQSCIVLTMQPLEHTLHSDCGSRVCDGFCVVPVFFSLKLVKQL